MGDAEQLARHHTRALAIPHTCVSHTTSGNHAERDGIQCCTLASLQPCLNFAWLLLDMFSFIVLSPDICLIYPIRDPCLYYLTYVYLTPDMLLLDTCPLLWYHLSFTTCHVNVHLWLSHLRESCISYPLLYTVTCIPITHVLLHSWIPEPVMFLLFP